MEALVSIVALFRPRAFPVSSLYGPRPGDGTAGLCLHLWDPPVGEIIICWTRGRWGSSHSQWILERMLLGTVPTHPLTQPPGQH